MTSGTSKWIWIVQAATGIALAALVAVHWVVQHYVVAGGERTYAEIVDYVHSGAAFGVEVGFLVIVTAHALLGVRAVVLDFHPGPRATRWLNAGLAAAGVIAVVYGINLIRAVSG